MKSVFAVVTLCIITQSLFAQEPAVKKIWGVISDKDSKINLAEVAVQILNMPQTTKSNERGEFSLYIENPPSKVTISYYKEGYELFKEEIAIPLKTGLEINLKKINKPNVSITQVDFGSQITGNVDGIPTGMEGKYKILVYVYTDTYYIHPYTYSEYDVKSNGAWSIQSVWHSDSPCPTRVMAILVDINFKPQSRTPVPVNANVLSNSEVGKEKIKCN